MYWLLNHVQDTTYYYRLIIIGLTQKLILRVHHVSQQSTHYKIGLVSAQWEMLFNTVCLGTTKGY